MSDDDLIRRGDALEFCEMFPYPKAAIAALPAQGVRVKPLVWEPSTINKPWHSAKCPWGWYYAQWDDETQAWFASLEMGGVEAPIILQPQDVVTLEVAKTAAQADYECRIFAALEPAEMAGVDAIKDALASLDMARDKLIAALNAGENDRQLEGRTPDPQERHEAGEQGRSAAAGQHDCPQQQAGQGYTASGGQGPRAVRPVRIDRHEEEMKTKTVTMTRALASFSSAAQHMSYVKLSCPPWETPDEPKTPEPKEKIAGTDQDKRRGPRYLGPYRRDRERD